MKSNTIPLIITIVFALIALAIVFKPMEYIRGSAPTGVSASLDVATTTEVGPNDITDTIFSVAQGCDARIITTRGDSAIMLSFGDNKVAGDFSSTTLSGAIGHLQLASTTVVYDSGLYGCGRWTAFSWVTTTISVTEL